MRLLKAFGFMLFGKSSATLTGSAFSFYHPKVVVHGATSNLCLHRAESPPRDPSWADPAVPGARDDLFFMAAWVIKVVNEDHR